MAYLVKLSILISRLCQFIGGISLIIIVLTTMLDVIARYIFKLTGGEFGFTVKGSVETNHCRCVHSKYVKSR